jgi:hypothetical protein
MYQIRLLGLLFETMIDEAGNAVEVVLFQTALIKRLAFLTRLRTRLVGSYKIDTTNWKPLDELFICGEKIAAEADTTFFKKKRAVVK